MKKTLRQRITWRSVYAVCALLYLVWVGFLSQGEIDMVNSRYSRANERLEPAQVKKIALRELVDECRRERERSNTPADARIMEGEDPCLSPSSAAVKEQQEKVRTRLLDEKKKAGRKLILFYVTFVVFFLVLPVVVSYYLLAFIIWMARGTKSSGKVEKE